MGKFSARDQSLLSTGRRARSLLQNLDSGATWVGLFFGFAATPAFSDHLRCKVQIVRRGYPL